MSAAFGTTFSLPYRRVQVVGVTEDLSEVKVTDATGWRSTVDGRIRPKGSPPPEVNEVWLIERLDARTWILKAMVGARVADLGGEINALVAQQVRDALAADAAEAAITAAAEAALAAGIADGTGRVIIADSPPGIVHENANTLWIDTRFGEVRPMRWAGDQWVVVVDRTAIEAARIAVAARDASEAATQAAADAAEVAAEAKRAADAAVGAAEDALAAAAGKGRIIYGDPASTPGETHSLLVGPNHVLYYWDGIAWVEVAADAMLQLRDELDALIEEMDANISEVADLQEALTGAMGRLDGKSSIWPIGSSPVLGPEDAGDLRLLASGGVEYWDGDSWEVADPRVASAILSAAEAMSLAHKKTTTYYSQDPPTFADIDPPETEFGAGDLWLRSTDNRLHRWDGVAWVEVKDAAITSAEGMIGELQSDLAGVEGKVDGKSTIYVQDTAPTGVHGTEDIGDLWIDTANGTRVYKAWNGTAWVLADDPRVVQALEQVGSKINTYYGATEPVGTVNEPLVIGDLWIAQPNNIMHRWDGAAWVEIADVRIGEIEDAMAGFQESMSDLNGKIDGKAVVYVQDDDPSAGANPAWNIAQKGDIWIDTSGEATLYKVWLGSRWETVTDPQALAALEAVETKTTTYFAGGTTHPTGPGFPPTTGYAVGDLWVRATDNRMHRWDGVAWVEVKDAAITSAEGMIGELQSDLAGVEGKVDGKATIWYQPTAPADLTSTDAGDIWIDSDADPKTYRSWDGTGWVDVTDQHSIDTLAKVNTKSTTYYAGGTTAPTGISPAPVFAVGDLWVHSTTKALRRYNGSAWVDITDVRLTDAVTAIGNFQGELADLDGKIDGRAVVHYGGDDPKDLPTTWGAEQVGDIWIDTAGSVTVYKVWNGSGWQVITDPVATQALSTVRTKITTYYKATVPTTADIAAPETAFRRGDLWIKTPENILHRYDGAAFVEVADIRLSQQATAISNLQGSLSGLQGQLDGKATIWYQPNDPKNTGGTWGANHQGDIWIDSDANPKTFKSWSGSAWVDVTDQTALDALAQVTTKTTTYYAAEKAGPAPDVPTPTGGFTVGDLWSNQSQGNALYRWSGTVWELMALGAEGISARARDLGGVEITASGTAPNNPLPGDLWIDISEGSVLKRWDGTAWVVHRDEGIQDALEQVVDARAVADGKVRIFSQDDPPENLLPEDEGDLWIETDNGNKLYVWTGTAWDPKQLGNAAIEPKSLVGSDVIADATVTAGLLEAELVLATKIIGGSKTGNRVVLDSTGIEYLAGSRSLFSAKGGNVTFQGVLIAGEGNSWGGGLRISPDSGVTGGASIKFYPTGSYSDQPGSLHFADRKWRSLVLESPSRSGKVAKVEAGYSSSTGGTGLLMAADYIEFAANQDVLITSGSGFRFESSNMNFEANAAMAVRSPSFNVKSGEARFQNYAGGQGGTVYIGGYSSGWLNSPTTSYNLDIGSGGAVYLKVGAATPSSSEANYLMINGDYVLSPSFTTSNPNAANAFISGSGRIYRSSSLRAIKAEITDLAVKDAYRVLDLRPVTYRDKATLEEAKPGEVVRTMIGLIAEDVAESKIPEIATYDLPEDGGALNGVAYDRVAVAMLPVMKDMLGRIERLENRG